jgi:hypothetical protein
LSRVKLFAFVLGLIVPARSRFVLIIAIPGLLCAVACAEQLAGRPLAHWWKGNLHTHTFWSDGDDYPEMVTEWYKTNGYNFLAISDHNILLAGNKWISTTNSKAKAKAFERYRQRFDERWIQLRTQQNTQFVRLRPLDEFRYLFEEPRRFLLIPSEEITAEAAKVPIHLNATNLRDFIRPRGGTNVSEVLQQNVDAVIAQHERTRVPMFPHINHPNFGWAITAEDLMRVRGDRFFEIYNGHPEVRNAGDTYHASTERVWDILLSFRLAGSGLGPVYALAVDDSHHYHAMARTNSNPGRGWVMVRAAELNAEGIIAAMQAGDFYASSGVRLRDVRREDNRLSLSVQPEAGISYTTQFIGTRKGFDQSSEPGDLPPKATRPVTRRYSPEIGTMLAEVKGLTASYTLKGDELYVRARIISSKPKVNATSTEEMETAWTQPLTPGVR